MPSPIATINGQDVVEYLKRFAAINSPGKLEQHADWNMLMRSGALDNQGLLEVFYGGVTSYPGDTITLTFENGTTLGPDPWLALYLGPSNPGPLQTGGDFFNFFALGIYPASFEDTSGDVMSTTTTSPVASASSMAASSSKTAWDSAYPTPEPTSPDQADYFGLPQSFFLHEASIAVLSIPEFTANADSTEPFVNSIKRFISQSKKAGLKKVVIDVQQNKGGQPFLAIEVFKLVSISSLLVPLSSES